MYKKISSGVVLLYGCFFANALLTKTSTLSIKIFMDKQIFSNLYYSNSSLTIWYVRRKQKILYWTDNIQADGNLITGQNPQSTISVAKAVVKQLLK